MSMVVRQVPFNIGTGIVGSTVDVTSAGLGTCKLAFFMAIGQTGAVDAGAAGDSNRMFGWAANTTEGGGIKNCVLGSRMEDAAATASADAAQRIGSDGCVAALQVGSGSLDGLAAVTSFITDGVRLTIQDQFTINQRVVAVLIGGSDISNIEAGAFNTPTVGTEPFTQDVTTGFTCTDDNALLVLVSNRLATDPDNGADSHFCLGMATSPTKRFALACGQNDVNAGTTLALRKLTAQACYVAFNSAFSSVIRTADFNGWITNGFQLNWEDVNAADARLFWLVVKGGRWGIGTGLTATGLSAVPLTGVGFTPAGGLVFSVSAPEHTASSASFDNDDLCSMGGFHSASARGSVGCFHDHGVVTSAVGTRIETDEVYTQCNAAGAVVGLMDVQSMDTDGVTFVMDDADPSQSFFAVLFAGNPSGGGGGASNGLVGRRRRRR